MTKKRRKSRRTNARATGATGDTSKTVICRREDFQSKPAELMVTDSYPKSSIKKQITDVEKKTAAQTHKSSHDATFSKRKRGYITLTSWKIFSVSFFVPLDDRDHCDGEAPAEILIDWSNLLLYRCNRPGMLSHLPDKQARRMFYYKPTVLPELKLKCRTLCGSSNNHKNSFTYCQNDVRRDVRDNHEPVKSDTCTRDRSDIMSKSEKSVSQRKSQDKRRVNFVDDSQLVTVHRIIAWEHAYRTARLSDWVTIARNRMRFQHRVRSLNPILSPILNPEHRERIRLTRELTKNDLDSN